MWSKRIPAEDGGEDTRGYGIKEVVVDAVTAALSLRSEHSAQQASGFPLSPTCG